MGALAQRADGVEAVLVSQAFQKWMAILGVPPKKSERVLLSRAWCLKASHLSEIQHPRKKLLRLDCNHLYTCLTVICRQKKAGKARSHS